VAKLIQNDWDLDAAIVFKGADPFRSALDLINFFKNREAAEF